LEEYKLDWKREASDKLRCYEARKSSIESTTEEIRQLELSIGSIRSSINDNTPVSGGGGTKDTILLNNITRRKELLKARRIADGMVSQIEKALSLLDENERLVLNRFYICPAKGNVDRLCNELNIEKATVYRIKDQALRTFTIAMYGLTEL
jgi:DNA-directed RNA polymerase specialized sigma subunit